MTRIYTALMAAFIGSTLVVADDAFLEGFPDVPLVEGVREIAEERVVFDTPAGTVAQTVLTSDAAPAATLGSFSNALVALGWTCKSADEGMGCDRDSAKLSFRIISLSGEATRIMLRLEPAK